MASSPTVIAPHKPLEDPLAHLPCSSIVEYRKGQMIYNQDQPSTSIYLVIDGKVKVSRLADDGHQVSLANEIRSAAIPAAVNRSITSSSTPQVIGLMKPSGGGGE